MLNDLQTGHCLFAIILIIFIYFRMYARIFCIYNALSLPFSWHRIEHLPD